uniref:(northern house mosquito) hypothetical protein n=1 Tax=Culex pipiens TaxID=7175 RepID=A0A8D8H0E1_CULPI
MHSLCSNYKIRKPCWFFNLPFWTPFVLFRTLLPTAALLCSVGCFRCRCLVVSLPALWCIVDDTAVPAFLVVVTSLEDRLLWFVLVLLDWTCWCRWSHYPWFSDLVGKLLTSRFNMHCAASVHSTIF